MHFSPLDPFGIELVRSFPARANRPQARPNKRVKVREASSFALLDFFPQHRSSQLRELSELYKKKARAPVSRKRRAVIATLLGRHLRPDRVPWKEWLKSYAPLFRKRQLVAPTLVTQGGSRVPWFSVIPQVQRPKFKPWVVHPSSLADEKRCSSDARTTRSPHELFEGTPFSADHWKKQHKPRLQRRSRGLRRFSLVKSRSRAGYQSTLSPSGARGLARLGGHATLKGLDLSLHTAYAVPLDGVRRSWSLGSPTDCVSLNTRLVRRLGRKGGIVPVPGLPYMQVELLQQQFDDKQTEKEAARKHEKDQKELLKKLDHLWRRLYEVYLVQWRGLGPVHSAWVSRAVVEDANASALIGKYERRWGLSAMNKNSPLGQVARDRAAVEIARGRSARATGAVNIVLPRDDTAAATADTVGDESVTADEKKTDNSSATEKKADNSSEMDVEKDQVVTKSNNQTPPRTSPSSSSSSSSSPSGPSSHAQEAASAGSHVISNDALVAAHMKMLSTYLDVHSCVVDSIVTHRAVVPRSPKLPALALTPWSHRSQQMAALSLSGGDQSTVHPGASKSLSAILNAKTIDSSKSVQSSTVSRRRRPKWQYLVKWESLESCLSTWEDEDVLLQLVGGAEEHKRYTTLQSHVSKHGLQLLQTNRDTFSTVPSSIPFLPDDVKPSSMSRDMDKSKLSLPSTSLMLDGYNAPDEADATVPPPPPEAKALSEDPPANGTRQFSDGRRLRKYQVRDDRTCLWRRTCPCTVVVDGAYFAEFPRLCCSS